MADIRLSDGSLLEVNLNFLTVKILSESNIDQLDEKMRKLQESNNLDQLPKLQMKIASKVIYAILRSNGKKVDMEEALALVPADDDTLELLLEEFERRASKLKKKRIMR